jgi:hypothetical protein
MARRVFYSFHYQFDGWRAAQVRNIGVVEGNEPAGDNKWEEVKRGGDAAIRRWIDNQLVGRSCTIVLVGEQTAHRKYVKYEIEKSWNDGDKGLFGIRIHGLLDNSRRPGTPGPNPFDGFSLKGGGTLASRVRLYDPGGWSSTDVYSSISDNIADWIERAIADR